MIDFLIDYGGYIGLGFWAVGAIGALIAAILNS